MKEADKVTVRTEIYERWILRRSSRSSSPNWCDECELETTWLKLSDATSHRGGPLEEILNALQNQNVHARTTDKGELLVCEKFLLTNQERDEEK